MKDLVSSAAKTPEVFAPGTVTEGDVREALRVIVENRQVPALNYAVHYAQAGIALSGEALHVQCLYVLNNLSTWRGDPAKAVRGTLKRFTKQKGGR